MTQSESLDKMKLKELVALAESMHLTHLAGKNKAQLREYILQNQRAEGSEQKTESLESTEPPTKRRSRRAKATKVVETPDVESSQPEVATAPTLVEETSAPKKRGRRSRKVKVAEPSVVEETAAETPVAEPSAVEETAAEASIAEPSAVKETAEPQVAKTSVKPKRKYTRRRKTQDASIEATVQEPTLVAPEPAPPKPAQEEDAPVVKKRRRYTRRKTAQPDSAPSLLDAFAVPVETQAPDAASEPVETKASDATSEPVETKASDATPAPVEESASPKRRRRARAAKPVVEGAPKLSRRSRKVDVASKDDSALQPAPVGKDARRKLAKDDRNANASQEVEEYLRLSVCGPFWLLAQWKLAEKSISRVRAAMGRRWHTSTPQARVFRVDRDPLVSVFRRVHVSSVPIVPDVECWYLPVEDPPSAFMIELGYEARDGEFFTVSSSNIVDTPPRFMQEYQGAPFFYAGNAFDRTLQQSNFAGRRGGLVFGSDEELAGAFVDGSTFSRLMGEPAFPEPKELRVSVEAEVVIKGRVSEGATVTVRDEPTPVNDAGEFAIRAPLPERRHLFPVVATNLETLETQTIVVSIERNTKVLDRVFRGEEE